MTKGKLMTTVRSISLWILGAAAVYVTLYVLLPAIAHAATGDPTPAPIVLGWPEYVAIGLAALAGIRVVVDALLAFFRVEAPLTKTTLDDRIRDGLQGTHDKLDKIAAAVNGLVDARKPVGDIKVTPGAQAGFVAPRLIAILTAIALVGAAGLALAGCPTAGQVATTAGHDLVNCTGTAIGTTPALDVATLVAIANAVTNERAKCTPAGGSLSWSCVETDALAEGKVLGGCTLVELVAGAPAAASGSGPGPAAARIASPDPGRSALEDFRSRAAGGATYHTAAGDL